jgi:hypothetical protein
VCQCLKGRERRIRHDHETHVAATGVQRSERLEQQIHSLVRGEIAGENHRPRIGRDAVLYRKALALNAIGNHMKVLRRGGAPSQQGIANGVAHGDDAVGATRQVAVQTTRDGSDEPAWEAEAVRGELAGKQGVGVVNDRDPVHRM